MHLHGSTVGVVDISCAQWSFDYFCGLFWSLYTTHLELSEIDVEGTVEA